MKNFNVIWADLQMKLYYRWVYREVAYWVKIDNGNQNQNAPGWSRNKVPQDCVILYSWSTFICTLCRYEVMQIASVKWLTFSKYAMFAPLDDIYRIECVQDCIHSMWSICSVFTCHAVFFLPRSQWVLQPAEANILVGDWESRRALHWSCRV